MTEKNLSPAQEKLLAHVRKHTGPHGTFVSGHEHRTALALERRGLVSVRYQGPSQGWVTLPEHEATEAEPVTEEPAYVTVENPAPKHGPITDDEIRAAFAFVTEAVARAVEDADERTLHVLAFTLDGPGRQAVLAEQERREFVRQARERQA